MKCVLKSVLRSLFILGLASMPGLAQAQAQRPATGQRPAAPPANAQAPAAPQQPQAAPDAAVPQVAKPPLPSVNDAVMLIRTTIEALNEANITGNYSVLHDMMAPSVQAGNTTESLTKTFEALRAQKVDFGIALLIAPQFTQYPALTPQNLLRLTGYFSSQPRITFDLFYENVETKWRPYSLGVALVAAPAQAVPDQGPGQQPTAAPSAARSPAPKKTR